jgi:hypothetical protein
MTWIRHFRTVAVVTLSAAAFTFALASCSAVDEILEAENPARIDESQLNDEALVTVLTNSVIGALNGIYTGHIIRSSVFTDEMLYGINDEQSARQNLRIIKYDEGSAWFSGPSRLRFMGDSVASRLRTLLKEPTKDRRLALSLAYAGYGFLLLAETMCEGTVNVGSEIYTPKQLAQFGITRFEEAITIATAAGTGATDVLNLSRVGLARAALLTGDKAKVMAAASLVPLTFTWWVEYKNTFINNGLVGNVTGANHNLGVGVKFVNGTFGTQNLIATQTDPRVQHMINWRLGHNQLTKLYTPYQSLPFSGFNGGTLAAVGRNCEVTPRPTGCPILYENDTDIKLASGLEAMHHYYEAAGATGTGPRGTTLQFVNERRAFGNQSTVSLTGDALMAELREQRGKDFFLGGFRQGDLRRWKEQGVGDFFPTGIHPNTQWGPYGTATCYPLPSTEYEGNPNIRK